MLKVAQTGFDTFDFRGSGQEHQNIALVHLERLTNRSQNCPQNVVGVRWGVFDFDWKSPSETGDHGGIQQTRELFGIQRGAHDEHAQILAQGGLDFAHQSQRGIGVQAAFVKFVKDHQTHTLERRVRLHPTR